MARRTTHPEGLKEVNSLKLTQEVKSFVIGLAKDVETEKSNRSGWEKHMDMLRDMRYGYRLPKNDPWPNCANYSIPLADSHINRIKPAYINLLYGVSPIVHYEPYGPEDVEPAKKREVYFDWLMRTRIDPFEQYCIGTDKELEQGSVVYKTSWDYTTRKYEEQIDLDDMDRKELEALSDPRVTDDMLVIAIVEELGIDTDFDENIEEVKDVVKKLREGERQITLDLIEVATDHGELTACSIRDDIVVPADTTDLQHSRFLDQPFWRTTTQIKTAMRDDKYTEYPDETIRSWAQVKPANKNQSRLSAHQDDNILLHETCCWYDVDNSGIKVRCIATWPDNHPADVLRFIEVPYDHGEFPYDQVRRELNDPGFYSSRGIPALDMDYQIGITNSVNQAEDNGTITNKPTVVSKRNTVTNIKSRRYTPGEHVETSGPPSDYEIRHGGNPSQPALFQFAQYLKSWADQRIGNVTSGLSEANNLPGSGQGGKKTAKEIDIISSLQGEVQSLDMQVHQQQMGKVWKKLDALEEQYGPDKEEIQITGEEPIEVNRRAIQGHFNMIPNGRLDNTNPVLKANKAFNMMRIFKDDPDIHQRELKKMFITAYDHRMVNTLMISEDEKAQAAQMQKEIIERTRQAAIKEGLDIRQIDILLDVQKEALMTPITGRKYAPDTVKDTGPKKEGVKR